VILEANLTAAGLFGTAKELLPRQPITKFICTDDQDIYYQHHKHISATAQPSACELRMVRQDGSEFWADLETVVAQDANGGPVCCEALRMTGLEIWDDVNSGQYESSGRYARQITPFGYFTKKQLWSLDGHLHSPRALLAGY
jgi:PAS domain-containing protein